MIQKAWGFDSLDSSKTLMLRVLEDVAARRNRGDDCTDESVIAEFPQLMPELREMLSAMSATETARRLAEEPTPLIQNARASNHAAHNEDRLGRLERDMFRGYELGEVVGRGATGVVYRAIQTSTGREVAIKVLVQGVFESESEEARFEREAQILAQLKHPNIVTVYDTGWSSGRFFLVMDYVRGQQLDRWLRGSSRLLEDKIRVFASIADTVHAAHLRGVIHRDLKPSNILVDEGGTPHLLDFGLAKVLDSRGNGGVANVPPAYTHSITMTGQFVGSLPWASPEQAEGAPHKIDIRTDVYSLGIILYHALTGHFPYAVVGNIRDVIDRILTAVPPRLRSAHSELDEDIEIIVHTCLSKERDRRYQSAGELAQDLRRWMAGEPIAAKRDSSWYMIRNAIHHHRVATGILSGFVVLTVLYGVTMSILYSQSQRDAERSRRTVGFLQDTLFEASSHRMGSDATVSEILDRASPQIRQQFSQEPAIEAALQYTIGNAYQSLWQHGKAIPHLRRSLELSRESHGSEHPDTLKSMAQLAMVLAEVNDRESVLLFQEALATSRVLYGDKHPTVAEMMGGLAYALWTSQMPPRWEEARSLYEQSIALFRHSNARQNPQFPRTLTGFGFMLADRNENVQAEKCLREAVEMSERFLGSAHQYTLESLMGLSDVLVDLGRFDEAQEILEKLYPLAERQFGARVMPTVLRRTVYLQMARMQYETAERTLFEIQASACDYRARQRTEQAEPLTELARRLREKVGLRGADAAYIESIDAIQAIVPDSLESARALVALGTIRHQQERYAYAEELLRRCLSYLDQFNGPEFSIRTRAAILQASSLQMLGRLDDAESVLKDTFELLSNSLGRQDARTQRIADNLRLMYQRSGRTSEAAALSASVNP